MRALGALFFGFVLLSSIYFVSIVFTSGVRVEPQVLASSTELTQSQRLFLDKINSIRAEAGASELTYSAGIEELTDYRVSDMSGREYYSHRTPDGYNYSNYLEDYDIQTNYSCENLQLQVGSDLSEAIKAWENSVSHKECLLNLRITKIGFSYVPFENSSYSSEDENFYLFAMIGVN